MKTHLLVLALFVAAISSTANAGDMSAGGFAGTWKANFSKSKFPGKPPQVDMATVDPDGTVTVNETTAEGKVLSWHYTPVEGKAVPVIGRDNLTVLVKKVNDHTNEHTWNFDGRSGKSTAVLSPDGKTTTFTMDGTDKDGKPFHEVVVYDKE
jgi:YD repeat-containing protein